MYSQRQQNKSNNIHLVLFEMPERNKSSTLKNTHTHNISTLLVLLFFFFIRLEMISEKEKKKVTVEFLFQQDSYFELSRISKVNTENNFKWTHLPVRTRMQLIHF